MSENYYFHFQSYRYLQNVSIHLPEHVVPQPRMLQYRNYTFMDLFFWHSEFHFFECKVVKFLSSRTKALFKNLNQFKKAVKDFLQLHSFYFVGEYLKYKKD